jgi:hypothetical protein
MAEASRDVVRPAHLDADVIEKVGKAATLLAITLMLIAGNIAVIQGLAHWSLPASIAMIGVFVFIDVGVPAAVIGLLRNGR